MSDAPNIGPDGKPRYILLRIPISLEQARRLQELARRWRWGSLKSVAAVAFGRGLVSLDNLAEGPVLRETSPMSAPFVVHEVVECLSNNPKYAGAKGVVLAVTEDSVTVKFDADGEEVTTPLSHFKGTATLAEPTPAPNPAPAPTPTASPETAPHTD